MGQHQATIVALISLVLITITSAGCTEQTKPNLDAARAKPDTIPKISIKDGAGQFFSFFDMRAEMQTVEQIQEVSETARSDVMVTDPGVRLSGDLVIVADLRKKSASGAYRSWIETKSKWLDRVVPKTSKLSLAMAPTLPAIAKKRPRRRRRRRRPRRRPAAVSSAAPVASAAAARAPAPRAQVLLFSTVWCPSCKSARRFFQSKGVPFKELDVEKDQQAQQQYMAIQRAYKLRKGVVPLIIVNGRVFQGFSQPQVEAALAAGPPKPKPKG
jgi:mycoredoxin